MAVAASAAGAELVILAEAREDRPLPAVPAGRVGAPVLGATGEGARALLELRGGEAVRVGVLAPGAPSGDGSEPAPGSSRGPSLSGSRKPDVLAAGAALTALPDGGAALAGGTGVAAARIAVRAARLARSRPAETARSIRAALADPVQTPDRAPAPRQVPLGPLELQDAGVRFTLGAFERGDPFGDGTELHAAAMLELELLGRGGAVVRTLTPPGGARDLLPAEYAYSLPRELRDTLAGGPLRFRARARPPRGGPATTRTSPPLRAP
jgi:hypothetical protein